MRQHEIAVRMKSNATAKGEKSKQKGAALQNQRKQEDENSADSDAQRVGIHRKVTTKVNQKEDEK